MAKCAGKRPSDSKLCCVENDLVLSSDRGQSSLYIPKYASVEWNLHNLRCPLEIKDNQRKEFCREKCDRVVLNAKTEGTGADKQKTQVDTSAACQYPSDVKIDFSSYKNIDSSVSDLEGGTLRHNNLFVQSSGLGCVQSNTKSIQLADFSCSSNSIDSVQSFGTQVEQSLTAVQRCLNSSASSLVQEQLDNTGPAVGQVTSNISSGSSPQSDTIAHLDTVLDQLFEESVQERHGRQNHTLFPNKQISENGVHLTLHRYVDQCMQRHTISPDLKPSFRKRNCILKRSTCVRYGSLKLAEQNTERPPDLAVMKTDTQVISPSTCTCDEGNKLDCTCVGQGRNRHLHQAQEELAYFLANHDNVPISAGSVPDLQPSYRSKAASLCPRSDEDKSLQNTDDCNEEPRASEQNEDQVNRPDTTKCAEDLDTFTAGKGNNKGAFSVGNEEYHHTGNPCNEDDISNSSECMKRKRKQSFRGCGFRNMFKGNVKENDDKETHDMPISDKRNKSDGKVKDIDSRGKQNTSVSYKRRFSKSLEETGCHGNHSNEFQQQMVLKRNEDINQDNEHLKRSLKMNAKFNKALDLVDNDHVQGSNKNILGCHGNMRTNPQFARNKSEFTKSGTKRKRNNSGPGFSNRELEIVGVTCRKKKCLNSKNTLSIKGSKTKSNFNERNKQKKQKSVCRHKKEQRIIHKIHKTIAESSNLASKIDVGESKESAKDTEAVRIAELENMIPLDVVSCDNVRKRKARLKLEKAKGKLYRQVSSDGI